MKCTLILIDAFLSQFSISLWQAKIIEFAFNSQKKSLTDGQKDALRMFDSNGPFPFLQEGRLQDVVPLNICDFLSGGNATIWKTCNDTLGGFGYVKHNNTIEWNSSLPCI